MHYCPAMLKRQEIATNLAPHALMRAETALTPGMAPFAILTQPIAHVKIRTVRIQLKSRKRVFVIP